MGDERRTMPTTEILMSTLAGLGFLFFGLKMVTRNLAAMTGSRLRNGIAKISNRPLAASLFGALTGFVTQSGRTTAFIMASFVQAGIIAPKRAIMVVSWANFGCTLVILAAVFPVYLFALFLLATAGAAIAFERPKPLLKVASAVFGLALILFGLRMMSTSTSQLTSHHIFAAALQYIEGSLPFAFAAGAVLTVIAQSHLAIMLIAVAMASRGIFSVDQTLMLLLGTHAGSGFITYATGFHFRGQPRQIVMAQLFYNVVLILLGLAAFAAVWAMPGVAQSLTSSGFSTGALASLLIVALNFVAPLLLSLLNGPVARLCERLSKPMRDEDLARPKFLHDDVGESPTTTLILAEKEQLRLLKRLPAYCAALRGGALASDAPEPKTYHEAFRLVSEAIEHAQGQLMAREMSVEDTEWLINQQKRQELLRALDEACFELYEKAGPLNGGLAPLRENIDEALDALLLFTGDAMETGDKADLDVVEKMTKNHGTAMEHIRKKYLAMTDDLSPDLRSRILEVTSLYERAAWAARRFGSLLTERPINAS